MRVVEAEAGPTWKREDRMRQRRRMGCKNQSRRGGSKQRGLGRGMKGNTKTAAICGTRQREEKVEGARGTAGRGRRVNPVTEAHAASSCNLQPHTVVSLLAPFVRFGFVAYSWRKYV
jgi:hypothetical protein